MLFIRLFRINNAIYSSIYSTLNLDLFLSDVVILRVKKWMRNISVSILPIFPSGVWLILSCMKASFWGERG